MKKIVSVLIVLMLGLVGCGSKGEDTSSKDKKELLVLTSSGYQPFEMIDEKGQLYGFDIDVMNEAAKILGYSVKWQDMDFNGIITSLNTGEGDAAIAGITMTEERKKAVDFSESYFRDTNTRNVALVKDDGKITKTKDLKGKHLGVQMGTIQEELANEMEDSYALKVEKLENVAPLAEEVKNGIIDGMIVEEAIAKGLMEKNPGLTYFNIEEGADLTGNSIAFKKGSPLKKEFDDAIKKMQENGKLDELIKKWFK